MKTRYSLLGFLLLFCLATMAQSQKTVTWITANQSGNGHNIQVDKDDLVLLASSGHRFYSRQHRNPCQVFIGVGTLQDVATGGLKVDYTVDNTPATTYGVQKGDIIVSLDGVKVGTQADLEAQRDKHQQGDAFSMDILRNGSAMTINARFKTCSESEKEEARKEEAALQEHLENMNVYFPQKPGNDPCKVFIGVYTTDFASQGKGVRVSGVVDNTPAFESAVQSGDVIMALDDQPVSTNAELRQARDKHQPGDQFRLKIVREGVELNISATFKACPNATKDMPQSPAERESVLAPPTAEQPDITLQLESFDAYPSPTLGPVNIRFEAKAVPTTVCITDVQGKMVYNNQMNQFNGFFNEQVNLDGKNPGIYTVTVKQGNKMFCKKIALLSRA
jgi:type II secretory pathway component PulC